MLFDIFDTFDVHFGYGAHELNILPSNVLVEIFELVYLSAVTLLLCFELVDFLPFVFGIELFELFYFVCLGYQFHLQLRKPGVFFVQFLVEFLYFVLQRLDLFVLLSE